MRKGKIISGFWIIFLLLIFNIGLANDYEKPPPPPQAPATTPAPSAIERRGETTVTKTAPTRRGVTISRPPSKTSGYLGTFNIQPNLNNVILYLSPLDIRTKVGEEFITALSISNRGAKAFDRLFVVLSYPPDYLEPLGFNDEWLKTFTSEPTHPQVFRQQGVIVYDASLRQKISPSDKALLHIKWRALKPTDFAQIEFVALGDKFTSVALGSEDILGDPFFNFDGVIPLSITITSAEEEEEPLLPSPTPFAGYISGELAKVPEFNYGMTLRLIIRSMSNVQRSTDSALLVDIYLDNEQQIPADNLNLLLQYDPRALEVIDYDEGNWISSGINIFDGLYHGDFPFDYQLKNTVYPQKGQIHYKMATSDPRVLAKSGTLATIKFKPLRRSLSTLVKFIMPETTTAEGTRITLMNKDVLGSPDNPADGIVNCLIKIGE